MTIIATFLLLKGVTGIAGKIRNMAGEELFGEDAIKQKLLELQMKLELGEMTADEYEAAETTLLQRLEVGRELRGED
ncbi:MAG: gas vesicle protein GvpG [Chloroflexi bacterium]|nr:gas vesicle protein GvpG [Chloroflexota bacterium]